MEGRYEKQVKGNKTLILVTRLGSESIYERVTQGLVVFPYGSAVKNPPANAGDTGSIPGSGRSPGEGNDNLLPCILAWEIPWIEKQAGYSLWGFKRDTWFSN